MDRRAKIIHKFGTVMHFCKLTDRNYTNTMYAIRSGKNPITLAEIDRDIRDTKANKDEPKSLTHDQIAKLHKAILSKYGRIHKFCEATGFRHSLISEIVTFQKMRRTKAIDKVFAFFGL